MSLPGVEPDGLYFEITAEFARRLEYDSLAIAAFARRVEYVRLISNY